MRYLTSKTSLLLPFWTRFLHYFLDKFHKWMFNDRIFIVEMFSFSKPYFRFKCRCMAWMNSVQVWALIMLNRIKMLILHLFFACILTVHCTGIYPLQINYTISRIADAAVVDCDTKIGYNPSNVYFRQLITEVKVLRISNNCLKTILPSMCLLLFAWNKIEISNLGWKTLDPDSFFGHHGYRYWSAFTSYPASLSN